MNVGKSVERIIIGQKKERKNAFLWHCDEGPKYEIKEETK
jgi:hypothetical protein